MFYYATIVTFGQKKALKTIYLPSKFTTEMDRRVFGVYFLYRFTLFCISLTEYASELDLTFGPNSESFKWQPLPGIGLSMALMFAVGSWSLWPCACTSNTDP